MDPILESSGARQPTEESTAPTGGLGDGERLAPMADESVAVPGATAEAAGSSGAEAGVSHATLESKAEELVVLGEQTVLPEVSENMVEPTIRPPSPTVVPLAVEEDEVEEIEREESRPQAV